MKLNRNSKIFINYFLGPALFVWLAWSIYREIKQQPGLGEAARRISHSLHSVLLLNLLAVLLLMIVNWSIEAFKWRLSVRSIQRVSFKIAFKAILSGVSFSVSTPNRMGEYLGRLLYMEEGNRLKTISLTIVSSLSQLIVTLFMGTMGLVVLMPHLKGRHLQPGTWLDYSAISSSWLHIFLYGIIAVLVILTLFYFRLSRLVKWFDRLKGNQRYAYLVAALEDFDAKLLWQLLLLSVLRFMVFIIQYYLLFRLFDVQVTWWQGFWAVSVSFLVLAIIPTFAIAEIGLRGQTGIMLVGIFSSNNLGIWFSTVTIWFINLIIPAITGSVLILGIKKIFTNKNERT